LAFAQRQIRVSRAHIPIRRKQFQTVIKTIGDYIQTKRCEKGLHRHQLAGKMRAGAALIAAWGKPSRAHQQYHPVGIPGVPG